MKKINFLAIFACLSAAKATQVSTQTVAPKPNSQASATQVSNTTANNDAAHASQTTPQAVTPHNQAATAPQQTAAPKPNSQASATQVSNTTANNDAAHASQTTPHAVTPHNQAAAAPQTVSQPGGAPPNQNTPANQTENQPAQNLAQKTKKSVTQAGGAKQKTKPQKAPIAREIYERECKEGFYNAYRASIQSRICQKGGLVVGDVNCNKEDDIITDFSRIKIGETEIEQKENLNRLCYFASGGKVNSKNAKGEIISPLVIKLKKTSDKQEEEETEITIHSRVDALNAFGSSINYLEKKMDPEIIKAVEKTSPIK